MYKLIEDQDNYFSFSMDLRQYVLLLAPHLGEIKARHLPKHNISIAKLWKPIDFVLSKNNLDATKAPDWSFYMAGDLILNEKAKNALESFLVESGELLPLKSEEGTYYYFNCLVKYDHGDDLPTDKNLFKASPTVGIDLIVSDAFKAAAQEAGLEGIYFTSDIEALA